MNRLRNRHFFASDVILLPLMAYLAFVLRLETFALDKFWVVWGVFAVAAIVAIPLVFQAAGIYSRFWRYASVDELSLLSGAVIVAVALTTTISMLVIGVARIDSPLPRSIPFIFLFLALAATAGSRLGVRVLARYPRWRAKNGRSTPVLVMGAGDAGAIMVREFQDNPQLGMEVVGLLDDDPTKRGVRIHGVPVVGDRHDIPRVAQVLRVRQVIIAMPTAPGKVIREIVQICEQARLQTKIIPGIYELLNGSVNVTQVRNVQIEDLLRREVIETDIQAVKALLRGKRVLITGGGGSIGGELCRQVVRCEPAELIIVGHGENSIFEITDELRRLMASQHEPGNGVDRKPSLSMVSLIADIRSVERIRSIFKQYRPEVVFHAAAHKHVPLMELNPAEAVTNNIIGTRNLLNAALEVGVEHFVMISTDKAVNPTSIMGASKRVAELLVHRAAEMSGKPYVAVRFGNVLGSRGSVVLTFRQQIVHGGPVTITHPEMKRYFMTIPEAVQLVLQAAALGRGGEAFVLDMGEPVRIVDLAHDLIRLSGLEVGRDIDVVFTGTRPGEKLFEELFVRGEQYERTSHAKIFIAKNASSFVPEGLDTCISILESAARHNDRVLIIRGLRTLVPEYQPREDSLRALVEEEQSKFGTY